MANITITVVIDKLDNEEIDMLPDQLEKVILDAQQNSKLVGKVTECAELDREEDEPEEEEVED
jgi:hypothetical protein